MIKKPKIDRMTVVTQNDEQVSAEVDGEIVMMSVERGNYYGLGAVGSRIWELIREPRSVVTLCAMLGEEFEVDGCTCEQDVLEFLNTLADEKLIKVIDEPPDPILQASG